jgi:hypothetical protein
MFERTHRWIEEWNTLAITGYFNQKLQLAAPANRFHGRSGNCVGYG